MATPTTTPHHQTAPTTSPHPPLSNVVVALPPKPKKNASGLPEGTQCTFAISLLLLLTAAVLVVILLCAGKPVDKGPVSLYTFWLPSVSLLEIPLRGSLPGDADADAPTRVSVFVYNVWTWYDRGGDRGEVAKRVSNETSAYDWADFGVAEGGLKKLDTKTPATLFIVSAVVGGAVVVRYLAEIMLGIGFRVLGPPPPTCFPADIVRNPVRRRRLRSTGALSAGTILGVIGLAAVLSLAAAATLMAELSRFRDEVRRFEGARPALGKNGLGVMWMTFVCQVVALGLFAWFWRLSNEMQRRAAEKRKLEDEAAVQGDVELRDVEAPPPAYTTASR